VQGFGSSPTQISKFLGFGEPYGLTVPGTDQLCTRGLEHIKEHAKLYIRPGGRHFLRGSWASGAGLWEFPHRNFEIFGVGGHIWTHGSGYRPAMHKGVGAYSRACQTVYSIRWATFLKGF
jgi:hypothetical protein